jgi:hypothetical protein
MSQAKKILMAGGTFSVALGIGFVMQNGDALAARFSSEPPVAAALIEPVAADPTQVDPMSGPVIPVPQDISALVDMPSPVAAPDLPEAPVQLAALDSDAPVTDAMPTPLIAQADCTPMLDAVAGPAALVALSLSAPCQPNAQVTIHHQGMIFSAVTDDEGHATIDVPALSELAVFIAAFDNGEGAVASVPVPDFASYERAVLQWQGDSGLAMHAYEDGAGYDDPGHIWRGAERNVSAALAGQGGFMTLLGAGATDNPMMAEIYTIPTGKIDLDAVSLSAEAEITLGNCGRDLAAQSIQIIPGQEPVARDLTLTMPNCDAVGDFLVLNGMFGDLKLASN